MLNGAQFSVTRPYCASSQSQKLNASLVVSWPWSGASTIRVSMAWYGTPSGLKYPEFLILPYWVRNRAMYSLSPPGLSLSISVAVIASAARPAADAVIVAVPPAVSASSAADTVTVTPVFQLPVVSVSDVGATVMSVSPVRVRLTGTPAAGASLNVSVTVALAPSGTPTAAGVATSRGPDAGSTVNDFSATALRPVSSYALACTV